MSIFKIIKVMLIAIVTVDYGGEALARFVESDPIGLQGGPNPYQYVRSSPLKYVDPQGLKVHVDPSLQGTVNSMLQGSSVFSEMYGVLNQSTTNYTLVPNPTPGVEPPAGSRCYPGI